MSLPLVGVKVVELGVWVAGPGCAGILADWGADVVKVEPPRGDPSRLFQRMLGGDLPTNPVFELDNRAKRSIALDLSTDGGRQVVADLVAEADVFVTNIRPSALARAGLDPEALRRRHPGLVVALVTGYGTEGPEADRPGFDIAAFWARGGMAESLRVPGGPLPMQRGGIGDHSVAMSTAAAVCAALVGRATTGEGHLVTTSLLRQAAYTLGFDVNIALMWGVALGTSVRETMGNPSVNNYTAADGRSFWIVGLEGDRHWPPLARAVGHPEWLDDERFASGYLRAVNAKELIGLLDEAFATRPFEEWVAAFAEEPDVFWAPVQTIDDLVGDEQFHAAGGLVHVPDGSSTTAMVATPADFDGAPPTPRHIAPTLGEHGRAVLRELGRSDDDVEALVAAGAVHLR